MCPHGAGPAAASSFLWSSSCLKLRPRDIVTAPTGAARCRVTLVGGLVQSPREHVGLVLRQRRQCRGHRRLREMRVMAEVARHHLIEEGVRLRAGACGGIGRRRGRGSGRDARPRCSGLAERRRHMGEAGIIMEPLGDVAMACLRVAR